MDYGVSAAVGPLRHAVEALESVQARMSAAMDTAAYWRDEYAGHGMEGLGQSCEAIRAGAETIHAQAGALAGHVRDQAKVAGLVTETMAPEAVAATLTPVESELQTLAAHCLAGVNRCEDQESLTARNLEGAKPEWLMEQASSAASDFRHAKGDLESAAAVVADAIRRAREAGSTDDAPMVSRVEENDAWHGMPLPTHEDRAGAQTYNATDENDERASRAEHFRRTGIRKADDVADRVNAAVSAVEKLAVRPTGQYVGTARAEPVSTNNASVPDLMQGIAIGAAVLAEAGRRAERYWAKRKGKHT